MNKFAVCIYSNCNETKVQAMHVLKNILKWHERLQKSFPITTSADKQLKIKPC